MPNETDNFQESAPPIEMEDESHEEAAPPSEPVPEGREPVQAQPDAPAPRRKVKYGDQELDLDDEEFKKLKAIDMVRGGQEALRKAAEMRKQAEEMKQNARKVIRALKEQPDWALKSAGMSEQEQVAWAERLLAQEMLRQGINPQTGEQMSPDQMRLWQLQRERDENAKKAEKYESEKAAQEREEAKNQLRARFDREMTEALKGGGLPPTDNMIGRLAQAVLDFDFEVPARDLVPVVMEDFGKELEVFFGSLNPQDAIRLLPKSFLDELRKYDLAQAKAGPSKMGQAKPQVIPGNRDPNRPANGRRKVFTSTQEAEKALEEWMRR